MKPPPPIPDAEWAVMEVLWRKAPATAAEVVEALRPTTGWAPTTVKTLLARLVKKKRLACVARGPRFEYRPKVAREACLRQASASFLDRFFGGAAAPLALHFVRAGKLKKEDLDELRRLLDDEERRDA